MKLFIPLAAALLLSSGCGGGTESAPAVAPPLFTRFSDNALYQSSASAWNFAGIGDPTVLYDASAGLWKMWTSAGGIVPSKTGAVIVRTQYLTSPDGLAWTEYGTNPVLMEGPGPADWDRGGVETVCVLKDGPQYWIWYAGYDARRSPPVGMKIGVATSTNGTAWDKSPSNPVLEPGPPGAWDEKGCFVPTVVLSGGMYRMWYLSGSNPHEKVGLATWTP